MAAKKSRSRKKSSRKKSSSHKRSSRKKSSSHKKSSSSRSHKRKYSKSASKTVASAMRRKKHGTLKRGKHGHGGKVKSRKQAIAIGLSEARKKGEKVPPRKSSRKKKS